MKKIFQMAACLAVMLMLASCGGSSDSGGATPGPPSNNGLVITITTEKASVPTNMNDFPVRLDSPFISQVNVRVTFGNGTPIPDGTAVELRTSNVFRGPISTLDDPETIQINEFTTYFGSVFNESAGGYATFFVHGGEEAGPITLTASAPNPDTAGQYASKTIDYTITEGPGEFERLTIEAERLRMPANLEGLSPEQAFGTQYMQEVVISFRDPMGNLISPGFDETSTFGVAVTPVVSGAFSTLDDPETDENEILQLIGQGPVNVVSGRGTIFFWSGSQTGVATISVNAEDPFTGDVISNELNITIGDNGDGLVDTVKFAPIRPLYVVGSGGNSATTVQVDLFNSGNLVDDPNGFNNLQMSFSVDGQPSGEQLSGVNVNGQAVQGDTISVGTVGGFSVFELRSGSEQNTVRLTATADRSDNNVDNGIQDPVSVTRSVAIGDGVLHSLDITKPDFGSIFANRLTDAVDSDGNPIGPLEGTYSMLVSVIGTDKSGNPALPQDVQFGLIDSPLNGFPQDGAGEFALSGNDGDPEEGGTLFTAQNGEFLTAANGVQPGDTIMVFGEEINGNEDLESANKVQTVNSETSLNTLERFNRNNGTGSVINDGDIFPYIIGRAVDGNIAPTATLDSNGVGTTVINYPVSKLGKLAAIFVKGQGRPDNGDFKSVVDVEMLLYPGISVIPGTEPPVTARLVASPIIIGANQESTVVVCAYDAYNSPLQGWPISWVYSGQGQGAIDGQTGSGVFDNATGADGCAVGQVVSSGVVGATGNQNSENGFNFTSGTLACVPPQNQNVCVLVAPAGASVLNANPSSFVGNGTKVVLLTLTDGSGEPIPNVALGAECTATGGSISISQGPGVTNENGTAQVFIQVSLDGITTFGTGSCTFSAPGGSPSTVVTFTGVDICLSAVSPAIPAGCPTP